jgi:hypothetical protein
MGFQQLSLIGGKWIRHARSRSASPPMFQAHDFPDGLDRVGVVYLAIMVMIPFDVGAAPRHGGAAVPNLEAEQKPQPDDTKP